MRICCALLLSSLSSLAMATGWTVDHGVSRLGFMGSQGGAAFEGSFDDWQASMVFDPEDLANSSFDVEIDVTSVDTGSADRDSIIGDPEWFGFEEFPLAHFETSGFEALGDNRYEALGTLTIRAVSQEIRLPFSWVVDGDSAEMDGEVTLNRTNFNVGTGDWASEDMVGHPVKVVVDLSLQRAAD